MTSIPVVAHVLHSLEGGGTERTLLALLRAFDHSRLRHVVVPLRSAGALSAHLPDPVACRPIDAVGRSRTTAVRLAATLRRVGASVVHARNSGTWFDAAIAHLLGRRKRLVLGHHGFDAGAGFDRRLRMRARIGLWCGASFSTVCRFGADQLHGEAAIPRSRITVLPNGVDLDRFIAAPVSSGRLLRESLGIGPADPVVGIVGSLSPVKRHDLLIDAVALLSRRIPSIRLVVAGDGPRRSHLERRARMTGIMGRTRFVGWRNDLPALLASLDVFVCCSDAEGMSNAVLEAMASGVPIVATAVGGNAELIRDGVHGRLLTRPDATALTAAIEWMIGHPDAARRLGRAARARARGFDFARTVSAYESFYARLIGRETSGARSAPMCQPKGRVAYPPTCARPAALSRAAMSHDARIARTKGVGR